MNLKMKKRIVIILLLCLSIAACASDSDTMADKFKGENAKDIYMKGQQSLAKKGYKDAIKNFEGLDALYPFSPYEEQAQLQLIYAYYMSEDYTSAAATADRFIRLYPRSAHVDYAYYMKGMAHYQTNRGFASKYFNLDLAQRDLSSTKQSFNDFATLIQLYPNSIYASNAKARMVNLRNLMALHEVEVANYYLNHNAYLAAVNRANYVVEHYQTSPAVIPALGIVVQSYRKLGMNDMADQTLQVLGYNYPNSEIYKQLAGTRGTKK